MIFAGFRILLLPLAYQTFRNFVLCSKILRHFAGKDPTHDFLLLFKRYFSRTRHTCNLFENHKNKLTISIDWLLVTSGSDSSQRVAIGSFQIDRPKLDRPKLNIPAQG